MNSVERVKQICKERKIAISKLEKALGFANGYIGQLKKGVFPEDRLRKIAAYLNLSPEFIATGAENMEPDHTEIHDKNFIVLYRKLEKVPEDERQMMIEQFHSSIDVFLKRKGIISEEES